MNKLLASSLLLVALSIFIQAQEHASRPSATPVPRPTNTPNTAATNTGGWVTFRSDEGQFSVLIPETPETKVETTPSSHGPYTTTLFILRDATNIYLLGFVDYDPSFNFNRRAELEANRDNFIKGVKATLVSTQDRVVDGYSTIEFVAETADRVFTSRVMMVGRRPYQIAFVSNKGVDDSVKRDRFFNSFKIANSTATNTPVAPRPTSSTGPFNSGQSYYDQAGVLFNQKKYSEALDLYLKAVQANPAMADAYYQIGWIYNDMSRYNEAVNNLKQAISYRADYAAAHNELGYALHQLGRYPEAVKEYQTAIAQRRDYASATYNLGMAYLALNNRNAALEQYRILQRIDPARATKLFNQVK